MCQAASDNELAELRVKGPPVYVRRIYKIWPHCPGGRKIVCMRLVSLSTWMSQHADSQPM